jgi:hypothetical protein
MIAAHAMGSYSGDRRPCKRGRAELKISPHPILYHTHTHMAAELLKFLILIVRSLVDVSAVLKDVSFLDFLQSFRFKCRLLSPT